MAKASTSKSTSRTVRSAGRSATAKTGATTKSASTKSATRSAAVKSATEAAPAPKVVSESTPTASSPDMKKKELIDTIVERSGIKKKDAKPVVEAMLAVLGEQIAAGRELNLMPFGKLRINRVKQMSNGRVVVCKLRQSTSVVNAAPELAPADETLDE
ncbi:HU family DNA-binding protein [Sediminimonas qiaohouensis]|nr:HU family DNA-binding protein [Sediminimonas qiaohouensis]